MMIIDSNFECGNIEVQSLSDGEAVLAIRPDTNTEFFQWFYFRVDDAPGQVVHYRIANAAQATYPKAWPEYTVLASDNGDDWFRVPTRYEDGELRFEHQPTNGTAYAFFVPYVEAQREALLNAATVSGLAARRSLGQSNEGRALDTLVMGNADASNKIWIVSRQHAGEPMAEYCVEGFVQRLLDTGDAVAQRLLQNSQLYIVPNINPDGSASGNLRANAAGVDLNRVWDNPPANAPEIRAVLDAIAETGVSLFIDVHGDETRPFIWLVGPEGIDLSPETAAIQAKFDEEFGRLNAETRPRPMSVQGVRSGGEPGMSINYIAATYGAPGWIIELPFKAVDLGNGPDSLLGEGCRRVGRSMVEILDKLV